MRLNLNFWIAVHLIAASGLSCAEAGGVVAAKSPALFFEGWRAPLPQELDRDLCGIGVDTPLEVSADFNGDGKPDRAVIAVNESRDRSGLLVNLSSANSSRWIVVEDSEGTCATYGLEVYKPGIYTGFFCAATDKDCKSEEKENIKTSLPGISFFDFGRAGVVFFWNKKAGAFDRLWEGD